MSQFITVDPLTRIEGHLRVEVEVENGKVKDAWTSGTLFRGLELILRSRKAEDAWLVTQRSCGVCPIPHGMASSRSIEDAYKLKLTDNARLVRNLIEGFQYINSHLLHFYHLVALDYVDVTAVAQYKGNDSRLNEIKSLIAAGDTAPFTPRYNVDYRLPVEANIEAVAQYVEALQVYRRANEALALLGGKFPHAMSMVPGGVTVKLTPTIISQLVGYIKEAQDFIDNKHIPLVLAVAPYYLDYGKIGVGCGNFLAWGDFPDASMDPKKQLLPRGAIFGGDIANVVEADIEKVAEHVAHSWYKGAEAKQPLHGETEPEYKSFGEHAKDGEKYSWLKAPRYDGKPMEVGPLARMLVKQDAGLLNLAQKLNIGPSVLARIAARALEAKVVADAMLGWVTELKLDGPTFTAYNPHSGEGHGFAEAPRGALSHHIVIEGGRIKNYQQVVPTTWNGGPRDANGVRGPMEEALVGTPVKDPTQPVEICRVVRSFDPCIACAVHVVDLENPEKAAAFRVV
ncbi:MAG: nickel-dependent hydrogenase large subunit [Bacillota bacterium]|nr:nickel-dependent hydrogenase large subunit [Bacillota bacterium]